MGTKKIRIFVGSPSDMAPERAVANDVIGRLRQEYQGWVDLEALLYEFQALPANETPQQNIHDPALADVAIFLFWKGVGTQPLPPQFPLADETPSPSGTLWEFDRAYHGVKNDDTAHKPFILAYKKNDPNPDIRSTEDLDRARLGYEAIDAFKKEYIRDDVFKGYWTEYEKKSFSSLLTEHLRSWLKEAIPAVITANPDIPIWTSGKSPFPGLASFTEEYAPLFFGRGDEICDICRRIGTLADIGKPSILIVTGSSGVGKSSLLKAGVVPELRRRANAEGFKFRSVVFRPSQSENSALLSLAEALTSNDGLPELRSAAHFDTNTFAAQLKSNPELAAYGISQAIRSILPSTGTTQSSAQESATKGELIKLQHASLRMVIIVDQFEELYSGSQQTSNPPAGNQETPKNISYFTAALRMLADKFGFLIIGSMRDDYLSSLNDTPELKPVALEGIVGIGPVSGAELHKIIEYPVRAAGFEFEQVPEVKKSLATILLDEAGKLGPHSLPLIQFVLQSLFDRAKATGPDHRILTLREYELLGRVKGVLKQTASATFARLSRAEKEVAKQVFLDLVSIGTGKAAESSVRVKEFDLIHRSPAFKRCVDQFVSAHLLVRSSGSKPDTIRLAIAHEALIGEWPDFEDWINENKENVILETLVEDQANRWNDRGRKSDYLILTGDELHAAEEQAQIGKSVQNEDIVYNYVKACTRKYQWRRLIFTSILFVFFAWGLSRSLRDVRFQTFEETQKLLLSASLIIPYLFMRLLTKWTAMTRSSQRRWRSLYWGCVFLALYSAWGRNQSDGSVWGEFFYAWALLFPAAYHLAVFGLGPVAATAHKSRRKQWWRYYFIVPALFLMALRIGTMLPEQPARALLESLGLAFCIWLIKNLSRWIGRAFSTPWIQNTLSVFSKIPHSLWRKLRSLWRDINTLLRWLIPPAAIAYGIYLIAEPTWRVLETSGSNVSIRATPTPASFFVPAVARFNSDDSRDSSAWWQAALDPAAMTVVAITAAPVDGNCDQDASAQSLWGHLRRLGLTEGGLAAKGGCKVGRRFDGTKLIEEVVYEEIDKPLVKRVPNGNGYTLFMANDDGAMARRGHLMMLADDNDGARWLYTAFSIHTPGQPTAVEELAAVSDRRVWSYSKATDSFRIARVDDALKPLMFEGTSFTTVEIGRDSAGRLATLRYLDAHDVPVADADGAHRFEFSYLSRGQCKSVVAKRLDGSDLYLKPCHDERFEFFDIKD